MDELNGGGIGTFDTTISGLSEPGNAAVGITEETGTVQCAEPDEINGDVGIYQETVMEIVMVPREKFGAVIGRSGGTLRRMQDEWGVKMHLRGKEGVKEAPMEIVGDPLAVSSAATMLQDFLYNEAALRPRDPISAHQNLRETNYASLDFVPHYVPYHPKPCPEEELSKRLAQGFGAAEPTPSNDEICFQEVKVPGESVGRIIGRNGDMIRKIMDDTGAFIQFAPNEERFADERTLLMRGAVEKIQAAQNIVADIVRRVQKYGHA